jgi:hypothetical protein
MLAFHPTYITRACMVMKNQPPTSLLTFCPETIPTSDRQVEALTIDTGVPTGPSSTLQHSVSESAITLVSTYVDEQSSSSSADDSSDSSDVSSFHWLSLIIALKTLPA